MNTQEAIQKLKSFNYTVHRVGDKYKAMPFGYKDYCYPLGYSGRQFPDLYSARELIHLAKHVGPKVFNGAAKTNAKKVSKGVTRTNDRNILTSKDDEKIAELPNKKVSTKEDIWNWT